MGLCFCVYVAIHCSHSLSISFLYCPSFSISVMSGALQFLFCLSISAVMWSVPTDFLLSWSITFLTSPSHILSARAAWCSCPVLVADYVYSREFSLFWWVSGIMYLWRFIPPLAIYLQ